MIEIRRTDDTHRKIRIRIGGGSFALALGLKHVSSGMTMHAIASYKLRRLERRSNLPPARLVE
jgi:hypothetical protein